MPLQNIRQVTYEHCAILKFCDQPTLTQRLIALGVSTQAQQRIQKGIGKSGYLGNRIVADVSRRAENRRATFAPQQLSVFVSYSFLLCNTIKNVVNISPG